MRHMTTQQLGSLTGEYVVDGAHSRLGFVARHAMITKVRGQFNEFEGRAHLDFEDPSKSTAEATITVPGVKTELLGSKETLWSMIQLPQTGGFRTIAS